MVCFDPSARKLLHPIEHIVFNNRTNNVSILSMFNERHSSPLFSS